MATIWPCFFSPSMVNSHPLDTMETNPNPWPSIFRLTNSILNVHINLIDAKEAIVIK